ncbi:MAG TPA: beta-ketoacyl-ACP synthase 3 [Pseudonocardia sp.]|jgi:3-oxoacyl-[acyl-carrier-protein] synthase-3
MPTAPPGTPEQTAVGIVGTGSYLPERVVPNAEVAAPAGVDAEWIERRTGIRSRRRAAVDEATSDLAAHAARSALAAAGVHAEELAYVVVATSTPDQPQPATAAFVQDLIGARNAAAFDLNAVCSGFLYAMTSTAALLGPGGYGGYGLVIGADVYSRILDPTDRRTAVLFGDGAGAAVLGPVPAGQGILRTVLASDGAYRDLIKVPGGGSRQPPSAATVEAGAHWFQMIGREVRDYVAKNVPPLLDEVLSASGLTVDAVDHFVPHQANGLMLDDLADRVGLAGRLRTTVAEYGNTGAASVPITLDRTVRRGEVRPGQLVLLTAFGGGMAMAAATVRWAG